MTNYRGRFHENCQMLRKRGFNVRVSGDRQSVFVDGTRVARGAVEELNWEVLLRVIDRKQRGKDERRRVLPRGRQEVRR